MLKEGFETAKDIMSSTIRSDVHHDSGGDEQRIHNISTAYSAITFKHILLPVWLCSYRYRNKQYQVMVNARTTFNLQPATCNLQPATCNLQPSTYPCRALPAPCEERGTLREQPSTYPFGERFANNLQPLYQGLPTIVKAAQ
jgi:hypothetical protein